MKKKFVIRELPRIPESLNGVHNYYVPSYNEPLLEYVKILMHKYEPVSSLTEEWGNYCDRGMGSFARKYFDNELGTSAEKKYLSKTEIQETIHALGYDYEKFWYLLLFVNDYSYGLTKVGYKFDKSPKDSIKEFADKIIENLRQTENEFGDYSYFFDKPMEIILKTKGKHKLVVDDPITLGYIAACCGRGLDKIQDNSTLDSRMRCKRTPGSIFDESPLSTYIWHFAIMFKTFFKIYSPEPREKVDSTISINKLLLISRLLSIMGIYSNKKLWNSDDTIKGYLQQYRGKNIKIYNISYG